MLPNSLKATPLQNTGGTVQAGAEFGNPLAQIPGAQASPITGQSTAIPSITPLPFSQQEAKALTSNFQGQSNPFASPNPYGNRWTGLQWPGGNNGQPI